MKRYYPLVSMASSDVRKHLFKVFKYKYKNHDQLKKVINEIIDERTVLGSIHGYWNFQHSEFKTKVRERLEYIQCK